MRSRTWQTILWTLVALHGCASDGDDNGGGGGVCTPPAELTYSCAAVPLGSADSCAGGPALYNDPKPDLDKAFPLDCEAQLPFCVAAYPNSVQTCYCQNWTGTPEWSCPV